MTVRKIIHIDMDAFFASVEQRDQPAYQGKALAVGGLPCERGVIAAASYEARRFGVRSAMSSAQALRLCPELILLKPRFSVYQAVSRQIREIFLDFTDRIEPLSLDEAFLDVTENRQGIPSATHIAEAIRERIRRETGLTASAGVSCNKFLAKVASDFRKPDGLFVIPPATAETFLETLPIDAFYGIGVKTAPRLHTLGIHTGGDLKRLSPAALETLFGRSAAFYYGLARGLDDRPVESRSVRKSVGAEKTFPRDLKGLDRLNRELPPLAFEILAWLRRREACGRTLTVKVKYSDFRQITRSRTLTTPIREADTLLTLAEALLRATEAAVRPVRLLGLTLSNLDYGRKEPKASLGEAGVQLKLPLVLQDGDPSFKTPTGIV